jgi:serine/threonine protein kinase
MRTIRIITMLMVFLLAYLPIYLTASDDVALARANIIWNMEGNIGLTRDELLSACRFIEKVQRSEKNTKKVFLRNRTKLPCVIERILSPKGFLIKDLPGGHSQIGRGAHKVVKKAIFYGKRPKIVADCSSDASGAHEISVLKKLKQCQGIVPFLGSVARPKKRYSIFLEYFSEGSLLRKLKLRFQFSTDQMLKIAKDSARGLKGMHECHLIHRDLHAGNILLRSTPSGLFEAVLVDFGKAMNAGRAGNGDVPQAAKSHNPPEALLVPFSKLQRYLVDVYAMGCNYYHMVWKQPVPWQYAYSVYAVHTYAPFFREKTHRHIVSMYSNEKRKKIGSLLAKKRKGVALSRNERFQILVFRMIDFEPLHRPSMSEIVRRLQKLAPTL